MQLLHALKRGLRGLKAERARGDAAEEEAQSARARTERSRLYSQYVADAGRAADDADHNLERDGGLDDGARDGAGPGLLAWPLLLLPLRPK